MSQSVWMTDAMAAWSFCWFMDDFGNLVPAPDADLVLGFICGDWQ